MPSLIASLVFAFGVFGLFRLDRDREVRTSKALWIPAIWLWLCASRSLAEWLAILGWATPPDMTVSYMEGSPADRNAMAALLALGLIVLCRRKNFGPLLRANVPILLFFLYAALSTLWSDYPDITIKRWFKALGDLVMVMVVLTDQDWRSAIKRVLVRTGFLVIPHSILVIKYYPEIGRSYNRWTWLVSYTGITTHKNELGKDCLIFGIVFLWCFLLAYRNGRDQHRTRRLIAHGAALAMVVWLFAMANSVTSQVTFSLATAFFLAAGSRRFAQKRTAVHLLAAVFVLIPFSTVFLGLGAGALEGMGRDSTLTGRTDIWQRVLTLAGSPLFGTGFESFWLGKRLEILQGPQIGLNEAHNGYLEIYVTLGWIGVALLTAMIVTGYRNIIISFRRDPDVSRLRMAFFMAALVTSFTEAGFRMLNLNWITFLIAAMAIPDGSSRVSTSHPLTRARPSRREPVERVPVALTENGTLMAHQQPRGKFVRRSSS